MLLRWWMYVVVVVLIASCAKKEDDDPLDAPEYEQPDGSVDDKDGTGDPEETTTTLPDLGSEDVQEQIEETCNPGYRKCGSKTVALICNDDGLGFDQEACVDSTACSGGHCKLITCQPNQPLGVCHDETAAEICDSTGTNIILDYCSALKPICLEGECRDLQCMPSSKRCKGTGAIEQCKEDGSGYEVLQLCGPGNICKGAQCHTACDVNIKENTYTGCEYWAVDLDNVEGGKFQNVALVVSNPDSVETASVTITNMSKGEDLALPTSTVPPLGQEVFKLPKGYDLEGTMQGNLTFRLKASAPVTVHQFNPLNAELVYSNDASLLLPSNVAGKEFIVMSWPQRQADQLVPLPLRGFTTVIAVEKGMTTVTVKAPVDIEHGINMTTAEPIETLPAHVEGVYKLSYGEVLNLESGGGLSGPDLTGTTISADRRISVFSGHECANIPLVIKEGLFVGTKFCDHIESQAFPLDTWGSKYVADAFALRSPGQKDVWRIIAGEDGVTVNTDPPQPAANGVTLNKGQFVEFDSSDNFFVAASGPVSVGHFLTGSNFPGFEALAKCAPAPGIDTGIGDPAFTLTPPVLQLRTKYIVLTPENYIKNYLNISYRPGTDILLDGNPLVLEGKTVGFSEWHVAIVEVEPGVHRMEAQTGQTFGVTAYGYDCDVSYAYPGGLNLDPEAEEVD